MRVLAFAGALRAGSYNRKLLGVAVGALHGKAEMDLFDLKAARMPIYDGDIETNDGLPEGARLFKQKITAADALLISTPEYNHSIPGGLKNAIDWASRPPGNPFKGKVALLIGASPGQFGAVRAILTLRQVLTALFALVIPQVVTLPRADQAFDETGRLKDGQCRASIEKACAELLRVTAALKVQAG